MVALSQIRRQQWAEPANGETVIVYNNGVEVGRVDVVNGEWSLTLPAQTDGLLNITVAGVDQQVTSARRVRSFPSRSIPLRPDTVINAVADSQLTNNVLYTHDGTPTLTGTGEPGTTVIVSVDGTASGVPITIQPDGSWSWTAGTTLRMVRIPLLSRQSIRQVIRQTVQRH